MNILVTLTTKDDEEVDTTVCVDYEIIKPQRDVGIMHPYAQIIDVDFGEYNNDEVAVKSLNMEWLAGELNDQLGL